MMRLKVSREQWKLFLCDPEVVTLELLVVFLTLSNVFVLYRILLDVCPFPVFVTWVQLLVLFFFSWLFGRFAIEFPRQRTYFPPFSIDVGLYRFLALPIIIYLGIVTSANIMLRTIPAVAAFPIAGSPAIYLHSFSRFLFCGQMYTPLRWLSLGIMLLGSVIGLIDPVSMGVSVFPAVLSYGLCSVIFRAFLLENVMHTVKGQGDIFHSHTVILGLILLGPISIINGDLAAFRWLPKQWNNLFTYQSYATLISAGAIPFIKNIVANRMIHRTGYAPWRILESLTMIAIVGVGIYVWDTLSWLGGMSFALVFTGRLIGSLDVLSREPIVRRRKKQERLRRRQEAQECQRSLPEICSYDPTGLSDNSDHEAEADAGTT